jgi:putative FmdB family regulatory protein
MPRYEMKCEKCEEVYDVWSNMSEKTENVANAECPSCGSREKTEIMGCPSVKFANPVGTDRWNSESKGHDYRFKHNMDKPGGTRDQRAAAAKASRVGAEPYRKIDDISSGKHFGDVK